MHNGAQFQSLKDNMAITWLLRTVLLFTALALPQLFAEEPSTPMVLVTVAPHKYLVNRIAGDTVTVEVIVPPTANVHAFDPTPKQMMRAAKADLWFRIGESFEARLMPALKSHHPSMQIVDMRQGLDLIYGDHEHSVCCRHGDGMDLHFWLSPRQLEIQARTVANQLIARYPQHEARYRQALQEHLRELNVLDDELQRKLTRIHGKTILVGHPAYAYFCRDYDLKQLSIEIEGKDPTPQQLTALFRKAKQLHLKTVFTQVQFSPKVADLVSQQLGEGSKVITLDPYTEDYMQNLPLIARHFIQA
jgi:zinc transport system substrate-binding protein